MTVIYSSEAGSTFTDTFTDAEYDWRPAPQPRRARPARVPGTTRPAGSRRPQVAPMRHRGTGVTVSRAPHRRRPITPATTVVLALVAAAITVWLGLVAQLGGVHGSTEAAVPTRLAVVQVQAGESLQQVARRVAPEAPVADVVAKIRELNQLDTVALDAGQTLIAPIA
ncbi:LysM peptidoglycan-binding domain-containing protein [Mycolicibacterium vaccae]|uniref:LysM peptidoglycan-binding domain-containing protein n=1 Tax=Mycolicibacterium vaccae TaxID=1810 RepID=UPI003CEDE7A1